MSQNVGMQLLQQFSHRWDDLLWELVQHVQLVFFSMSIAVLVGVPLGILITRFTRLNKWVLGISGMMQTIPSLALLGFMIPIFGIGTNTAIAALFLYSLLPIIRNTATGIHNVDKATEEAARGMGMTAWQILFKVKLPLAFSTIMTGIRLATIINVGVATLAAFVGAGGLGKFIFIGISRNIDALVLLGAIPAALLTVILDGALGGIERLTRAKGLNQ